MKEERERSFSSFCAMWKTGWKNICLPDSGSKDVEFEKWNIGKAEYRVSLNFWGCLQPHFFYSTIECIGF